MWTCIASIVSGPPVVTTITLMAHAVRVVWTDLPAITVGLRAVSAALGVVTGIRAVCRHCGHRHHDKHHTNSDTRQ
jgi:hypothetical protein